MNDLRVRTSWGSCWGTLAVFWAVATWPALSGRADEVPSEKASTETSPTDRGLTILVMDPLAKELACDCVAGFAQRRYEALAMVLQRRLGRPCTAICGQTLASYWGAGQRIHLIVGKHSDVLAQAERMGRKVRPLASLTNVQGETTLQGLFVVRAGCAAHSIQDLAGYRVLLGPESSEEKHGAARAALTAAGVPGFQSGSVETVPSCTDAANVLLKLGDTDKAAAVISDYARVLLEGCHTVPPGAIRVIGTTAPVPFITVFATEDLPAEDLPSIRREILGAGRFPALRKLLESKEGFLPFAEPEAKTETSRAGWPDFRGPERNGLVPELPASLVGMRTAWTAPLEGKGLGGVTATDRWVLVTDRGREAGSDCLNVFDTRTGKLARRYQLARPSTGVPEPKLDYGDSVRASAAICGNRAFVLDAYGVLFPCMLPDEAAGGEVEEVVAGIRTDGLIDGFKLAHWGVASTPLWIDGLLVVNVCGAQTSLLAVEPDALVPVWNGAGQGTGYASLIAATLGGRRQIVGYQRAALAGWDIATGERLWSVRPPVDGDYNVPTPVVVDPQHLLVATENNGARLYAFDERGVLRPEPVAVNPDVAPDTVSPVAAGGYAYCTTEDVLVRLDLNDGLKTDWSMSDRVLEGHASLIADAAGRRLLVATFSGELLLFDVAGAAPHLVDRRRPAGLEPDSEIYAHPAMVGNRLYVRAGKALLCLVF